MVLFQIMMVMGLSTTESIMLHITDVNETPSMMISGIDFENPTIPENADTNNPIAVITTYDDDGDTVTLSVDNTADFYVDETSAGSGTFNLFVNSLDHETNDTMVVNITASDGNTSTTEQLSLNVTDVNEAPDFTGPSLGGNVTYSDLMNGLVEVSISEDATVGYTLTQLTASDVDDGDVITLTQTQTGILFLSKYW